MKKFTIGLVVALALLVATVSVASVTAKTSFLDTMGVTAGKELAVKIWSKIGGDVTTEMFGANPGPDKYEMQNMIEGYTNGGSPLNASSTLWIARTITAVEFCENDTIMVNSSTTAALHNAAASLDLTFAATSTLFTQCLNYPGAEKTIWFYNASPTAATTTELIAGTGCDTRISEATGADDTIDGLNGAKVTLKRWDDAYGDGGSVDCLMYIEENVVD